VKSPLLVSLIGKTVAKTSRLKGGHGSALPGLVAEKLAPDFLRDVLGKLPRGVVVISGTNGKTTTTKMVVELLCETGLKVLTNDSGANMTRGVASAAIRKMKRGKLNFDIAVLELDEAHAVKFVRQIPPSFSLLLNVFDDQGDRFGSRENVAKLLATVAKNTRKAVVLNRDNAPIAKIADDLTEKEVAFFGFAPKLAPDFPDNEPGKKFASVELVKFTGSNATYKIDKKNYTAKLKLTGSFNVLNGAAALALVREILGEEFDAAKMIAALEKVQPAFGRGETIVINGCPVEMFMVKNPAGFRLSLRSQYDKSADTMVAINNNIGDGTDPSWLNDVDFRAIREVKVASGMCTDVVAKRLKNDGVKLEKIEPDLKKAVENFLTNNSAGASRKQIFGNYTVILPLRTILEKLAEK